MLSSASAVTKAAVSPAASVKFVANNITRVCLSTPKEIAACGGNGSAIFDTDSSAIPRVEFARVNNTGALAAAFVLNIPPGVTTAAARQPKAQNEQIKKGR